MQTSAMKACFQIAERSLSYAKIWVFGKVSKLFRLIKYKRPQFVVAGGHI